MTLRFVHLSCMVCVHSHFEGVGMTKSVCICAGQGLLVVNFGVKEREGKQ